LFFVVGDILCVHFEFQWTFMLDLLEVPLKQKGILFARLDGSMSQNARENALNTFKSDPEVGGCVGIGALLPSVSLKSVTRVGGDLFDEPEGGISGVEPLCSASRVFVGSLVSVSNYVLG
jgi:hypothetical protein